MKNTLVFWQKKKLGLRLTKQTNLTWNKLIKLHLLFFLQIFSWKNTRIESTPPLDCHYKVHDCNATMERSLFSNILLTTRLLKHFNVESVRNFKKCLYKQFNCDDETNINDNSINLNPEALFLCKILTLAYKSLDDDTVVALKDCATKIAENQQILIKQKSQQQALANKNKNVSVYKYVELRNKNSFGVLHSDVIDYFSTFLSQKESIEFGYLNKHLFIETQKKNYLIKRCNDPELKLDSAKLRHISSAGRVPYSYHFPTRLNVPVYNWKPTPWGDKRLEQFEGLFGRLNTFKYRDGRVYAGLLANIPIDLLFNNAKMHGKKDELDLFHLTHFQGQLQRGNGINIKAFSKTELNHFFDNLNEYFERTKKDNIDINMRRIKHLHICISLVGKSGNHDNDADETQRKRSFVGVCKNIVCLLCRLSKSIYISVNHRLEIDTYDELQSIFHPDLEKFTYDSKNAAININVNVEKQFKTAKNSKALELETPKLKTMRVRFYNLVKHDEFLTKLDTFGLRQNVECYEMESTSTSGFRNREYQILNKYVWLDRKNSSMTKQIKFIIVDLGSLVCGASILLYLHRNKNKIDHLNTIEIKWKKLLTSRFGDKISIEKKVNGRDANPIFHENTNVDYSDSNSGEITSKFTIIQCSKCDFEIKSLVILYDTLIKWFKMIEKDCGISEQSVKGRALQFVLK